MKCPTDFHLLLFLLQLAQEYWHTALLLVLHRANGTQGRPSVWVDCSNVVWQRVKLRQVGNL